MRRSRKSNSTNIFCENYLRDRLSYWILKMILELGGKLEFIDKDNYCQNDEIANFLNMKKYFDEDKGTVKTTIELLQKKYSKLQNKKLKTHPTLQKNIELLSKVLKFSKDEKSFLEFTLLLNQYNILEEATELFSYNLNTS